MFQNGCDKLHTGYRSSKLRAITTSDREPSGLHGQIGYKYQSQTKSRCITDKEEERKDSFIPAFTHIGGNGTKNVTKNPSDDQGRYLQCKGPTNTFLDNGRNCFGILCKGYTQVSFKKISYINEELLDNPALINEDCYGAWLIKVNEVTEEEELLDAEEYEKVCAEEA